MPVAVVDHHSHTSLVALLVVLAVFVIFAVVFMVWSYRRSKTKNSVNLDVPVGETEKHMVNYFRNAWTGRVRITVDGFLVLNRIEWIVWKLQKRYEIPVGDSERHVVTFVKTRKKLVPGFRKQTVEALVDGIVVASA